MTEFIVGGVKYRTEDGTTNVTVIANSYSGDIVIPNTVTYNEVEYTVKYIGTAAFANSSITSIVLYSNSNIETIGNSAFLDCSSLEGISIPNSVTSIGLSAFSGCTSLTSARIGSGLTSIGNSTFSGCTSLSTLTLSEGLTAIGTSAFYGCTSLHTIVIPDSVTSIGNSAFSSCTGIEEMYLGSGVSSIGTYSFSQCNSIKNIIVSSNNENFSSIDGVLFNKNKTELKMYPAGRTQTSYDVPASVTTIGYYAFSSNQHIVSVTMNEGISIIDSSAFQGCTSITSLTIPNSVTEIRYYAFDLCLSLASVIYDNENVGSAPSIASDAFYGNTKILVPYDLVDIYKAKWPDHTNRVIFTIISADMISLSPAEYVYDGTVKTPTVNVTTRGRTLTSGTDYTVAYGAGRTNAGTYAVTVTGTGKCTGSGSKTFTIGKRELSASDFGPISSVTYTGNAQTPTVTHISPLTANDYTKTYSDNVNAGTGKVTISASANSNYKDPQPELVLTFTIDKAAVSVSDLIYSSPGNDLVYNAQVRSAGVTSPRTGIGAITVRYYSDQAHTSEIAPNDVRDVGTYHVAADVAEGTNYLAASKVSNNWSFTIGKYTSAGISSTSPSLKYNSTVRLPPIDSLVFDSGIYVTDGTVTLTPYTGCSTIGTHQATVTLTGDKNINDITAGNNKRVSFDISAWNMQYTITNTNCTADKQSGTQYIDANVTGFTVHFTADPGYVIGRPRVVINGSEYTGGTYSGGSITIPITDLDTPMELYGLTEDDRFSVSIGYDNSKRMLSSLEPCPIIGTVGDIDATRVFIKGIPAPASPLPSTHNDYYIAFDIRQIYDHKVKTSKVKLTYDSANGWHGDVPSEVFNNTRHLKLPMQLLVKNVTVSGDETTVNSRYYSFNQLVFRVMPAVEDPEEE